MSLLLASFADAQERLVLFRSLHLALFHCPLTIHHYTGNIMTIPLHAILFDSAPALPTPHIGARAISTPFSNRVTTRLVYCAARFVLECHFIVTKGSRIVRDYIADQVEYGLAIPTLYLYSKVNSIL